MTRRRLWRLGAALLAGAAFVAFLVGILFEGALMDRTERWSTRLPPALPLGMIVAGMLTVFLWLRSALADEPEPEKDDVDTPAEPVVRQEARLRRLIHSRDFLPEEMPDGWSRPLSTGGSSRWRFESKAEACGLVVETGKGITTVRVFIAARGTAEPVIDARCVEILALVRHVGEFFEIEPAKDHPELRMFVTVPLGVLPRWPVPQGIPSPRERVLSPHLVAARKYLPQKLPPGWSVPVAIGDDHGTEWKDGSWMIATDEDRFFIVSLVTSKGRVKLSVTFFWTDEIEVSEGEVAGMLRHFRGVLEFAQTEATEVEMIRTRTYLGEIAPEGGARVLLN
jgi:hypothetical protein